MRRGTALLALTLAILLAWWIAPGRSGRADETSATTLIAGPIDERSLITLRGNTRREANGANDRGALAGDFPAPHLMLLLRRSPERQQGLDHYVKDLTRPGSSNHHRWLTAAQLGQRYGLGDADLSAIRSWLDSHGFMINGVYPNRIAIDFSGNAAQITDAFHTEIHRFVVNGVTHYANMSDPQIPAALAPAIEGIASLNDFRPRPLYRPRANYSEGGGTYAVVPADLATIYDLNPLFNAGTSGQGQTIVVIEDTDVFTTGDWDNFRTTFKLATKYPQGSFTQIHPSATGNNCAAPGVNSDDVEAILDAEWASASAPNAAIELASCADTATFGGFIALQNLLNGTHPPAVVSISYGEDEADLGAAGNAFINALYEQAAAEGVSIFVAAGDSGAASTDQNATSATHGITTSGFATTQYNVAVGGTDFGDTYTATNADYWTSTNRSDYGSALSYIPEIPWNDSCASGLISTFEGFSLTYGAGGFCNSVAAQNQTLIDTAAGGGGPSGCAKGAAVQPGVVGGSCAGYAKPSWQPIFGNPADGVRDIPDVALFAADGVWGHYYVFCYSDLRRGGASCSGAPSGWTGGGGTSFAAPIMAGIQALADQNAGGRQGNPAPTYYALAAAEYGLSGNPACASNQIGGPAPACTFHDLLEGDMDVVCSGADDCYRPSGSYGVLSGSSSSLTLAYSTSSGWDFASGLGSVDAANLVDAFAALASPSPTSSATPTATATPSATPTATTTSTPTGTPISTPTATPSPAGVLSARPSSITIKVRVTRRDRMKPRRKSILLKNEKNAGPFALAGAIEINSITTGSSLFSPSQNCLGILKVGKTCRVRVTFAPTAPGTVTDQLTIRSSAANGAAQQIAVTGIALNHK